MMKSLLVVAVLFSTNASFAGQYEDEYNSLKPQIEQSKKAEALADRNTMTRHVCVERGLSYALLELRAESRALRKLISQHQDTNERRQALNNLYEESVKVSRCLSAVSSNNRDLRSQLSTYVDTAKIKCRNTVSINCDGEVMTFTPSETKAPRSK